MNSTPSLHYTSDILLVRQFTIFIKARNGLCFWAPGPIIDIV